VADDVTRNKVATIERCLARVRELFADDPERLRDQTVEDAVVLNLLRACEASIDLAMHAVARGRLGVPQGSREAFALLARAGRLDDDLARRLQLMVGFRNVAVHDYQAISGPILLSLLRERLGDFEDFCAKLMQL